jgi:plastocyanin
MKGTYIAIIVLIVLAVVVWFLVGTSKPAEAPLTPGDINVEVNQNTLPGETTVDETSSGSVTKDPVPPMGEVVKEFNITAKNFSFTPSTLTVKKGDRVRITLDNTQGFHDLKIDEFGAATKQFSAPGKETIEFVATKTGSFEYYCSVGTHRQMGMRGTLVVE